MFEHISGPVHVLVSRSFDSNIIYIDGGDKQVLVDAGTGLYASNVNKSLQQLGSSLDSITDVILTHSHIDHIGGVVPILENDPPKIHLHKEEADMINSGDMRLTLSDTFGVELPTINIEGVLNEGDVLSFGEVDLEVIHTPGHSSGSICLHIESLGLIITGDTLFSGGSFGRVDFPTGDPAKLVQSLKRLSEMKFEIALPGHMSPMRHGAERSAALSYKYARSMFS
ncbi:MAG: MBL fold metallo-hydrolase [Candidatus Thorarchaeota archaeon]